MDVDIRTLDILKDVNQSKDMINNYPILFKNEFNKTLFSFIESIIITNDNKGIKVSNNDIIEILMVNGKLDNYPLDIELTLWDFLKKYRETINDHIKNLQSKYLTD